MNTQCYECRAELDLNDVQIYRDGLCTFCRQKRRDEQEASEPPEEGVERDYTREHGE